ncbi:MAG: ABC transporter substrate-binding protein [Anaerolineae bacterium]|nr:ABC transporter substrate-binding protein [Anaerolineae bacterium]MDW8070522.1 ABC transporter substrate-binding protein [Anaerolineae bacterium]
MELRSILCLLLLSTFLSVLVPCDVSAAPSEQGVACATEYIVQPGDHLGAIAQKYLEDRQAYPAIIVATNRKHAHDTSFAQIDDPTQLVAGWKLCIPPIADVPQLIAAAELATGVEVVDALGRIIRFAQLPQRIVLAGKAVRLTADTLYLFPEARQRIVALEGRSPEMIEFLSLVHPDLARVQFLERNAGPEQIAATKPDVVILKSYLADQLGAPLTEIGIPVVYVDLETPEQFFQDLTTLGQLFGNLERAAEVKDFLRQRVTRVTQTVRDLSEQERPSVLILQYSAQGEQVAFSVPPATWIQTTMVEMAGGRPIWREAAQGGGWNIVGLEQIAAWDPDVICLVSYFNDPGAVVATIRTDERWQALKAVRSNRFFAFPTDFLTYNWDQPDPRWILGLMWLAKTLHPDRFATIDLREEIHLFFEQLYGLDRATVETKIIPILRGDIR